MAWTPDNLAVKGALAVFHQAMEAGPTVWDLHCQPYPSTTDTEALTFPGFLPQPRQFLDSRQFQGARDFRYNVQNNEYELSMITTRKSWEDDQNGLINARYAETGEVWKSYKDYLFSQLLVNGATSGNNGFDGTTFYAASHTAIGGSGTIVNAASVAVTDETAAAGGMLTTEAQSVAAQSRTLLYNMKDDQGRPFNNAAITSMRIVSPAGHERALTEAQRSSIVSQTSNVFTSQIITGVDVLPYLSTQSKLYVDAVGSMRKPFIYQERTALEVVVMADEQSCALYNGVMLLTRQRFVMTYGDPRRSIQITLT